MSSLPYVPSPLLGNKGAHIINGNIAPDSPSTTQEEAIRDIHNTSISQSLNDFDCFKKRGLHFVHLNARSILPKMEELDILAHSTNATIIAVTETWLDNTICDNEVCIPDYSIQRKDRNREGGGVCIFIRNNINFNRRSDIDKDDLEFLAIDIMMPKSKPILLGVGYRPPRDNMFYAKLEEVLSSCTNFVKQECYILGDFNTDVLAERNALKNDFENFLRIFDLKQVITEPTRITDTSETAIDLICTSDVENISQSGVLPCKLSDHNVIFCTRKLMKCQFKGHNNVELRIMKCYDKVVFVDKLRSLDWAKVTSVKNVNDSWKIFHEMFLQILDRVAPVKNIRLKQRTEQWFTGDILRSISVRDKAWKQYREQKTSDNFTEYKRLRNMTDALIKKAKKDFVKIKIKENTSCPKKLWKTLKNLGIPTKVNEASSNIGLKNEDDDVCFDSDFVANKFNRYFCNIAEKLVDKLPLRTYREDRVQDYYKEKGIERNSFKFNVVEQLEVENMLRSLDISKSAGEDKISGKFLRDAAEVISSPLTYIMNLSLKSATVPDDFKLARVLPIYKNGNRNYEGNYRPVSILPVASKVLEKIVYNQMHKYLEQNNLIYAFQSGFRSAHSTDTALTFLADKLRANMDEGLYTGMVLIDLQKAFDTVDYTILTTKLNAIGIYDSAGSWFKSYLTGRKQVVKINGRLSTAGNITCGVPQGSILGPLLFNIYVNDMITSVNCDLFLYADDSTLLVSGKNPAVIQNTLSIELNAIRGWLEENKLSIHLGKTESILIASKIRLARTDSLKISCGSVDIESKSKITYLGLTFDNDMSFSSMGNSVIKKVNAKLKFLYRKSAFFGTNE